MKYGVWLGWILGVLVLLPPWQGRAEAWEPQKPVEFVIPSGLVVGQT